MLGDESVFPIGLATTAVTDSQIRFFGTVWAGYGIAMWWASNDMRARKMPIALLGGISLAAGVGRALSAFKHGFGAEWTKIAMWAELLGPAVVFGVGRSQELW